MRIHYDSTQTESKRGQEERKSKFQNYGKTKNVREEEGTYVDDKIRSDTQCIDDARHTEAEEGHHW